MVIQSLLEEALPSLTTSTQLFANCPALANAAIITLRSASSAGKGITLRRDGNAATAGANGTDLPLGTSVIPFDQARALAMRAIDNGAACTGWIQYIKADADVIAALVVERGDASAISNLNTSVQQLVSGDVTPAGFSGTYISTATTTVVKTGAGYLKRIVLGETAAGTITVYDNTAASGTIIAVLKSSIVEGTYDFDIEFGTGLTVVTGAASKLTVVYS